MGTMAKLIEILLIERGMNKKELAEKLDTSPSNISGKLHRDNFSEKELQDIAKVCNATFCGCFILNDTGKEIKQISPLSTDNLFYQPESGSP